MQKKVIIGVSAFVGTNIPFILKLLAYLLRFYSRTITSYSLEIHSQEWIVTTILKTRRNTIHIVYDVSCPEQIESLRKYLEGQVVEFIHIETTWRECLQFLQKIGKVSKDINPTQWRTANIDSVYQKNIVRCVDEINKTECDAVYYCNEGNYLEPMAKLAERILLR
jgi:hypothetical protein